MYVSRMSSIWGIHLYHASVSAAVTDELFHYASLTEQLFSQSQDLQDKFSQQACPLH